MNGKQFKNMKPDGGKQQPKKKPMPPKRGPFSWLVIIALIFTFMMLFQGWQDADELRWDQFRGYVRDGYVDSVTLKDTQIVGKFNEKGLESRGEDATESFLVDYRPEMLDSIEPLLVEQNVQVEFSRERTWLLNLLGMLMPIILLVLIFYFMFARNLKGGAGGMLMNFGRSKHRMQSKTQNKVTFKDVAGIHEAKEEVNELIEFLKNPKKFQRLGGRIPRGVLLIGPPGCGKTLLAKAIAGEADVPFYSISGSDFVEMFVGVGASRVRDLFKQAKDNSPCIIFLDEIDAIGRKRGAGFASGGHDEREQTLNAILVEMDGFDTNDQVIVIAATNRGDILDKALTRPGRFDRQVVVPLPDLKGRLQILKVHAKKVKLSPDADLEKLARGTPMFSGADLAAIINEAALMATMANKDYVDTDDLEEARDKVRWGRAKRSRVIDQKEKEVTAYHEAGHTMVQYLLDEADPLHKVSIIPRGPMGGATFALPEKDRTMYTKKYCEALMQVCFGGRIAEEMFCDDISSGAQSDIQQATKIARQMVQVWGMSSELGPVSYAPDQTQEGYMPGEKEYSEKTQQEIDKDIRKAILESYTRAKDLIMAHKTQLQKVAEALLKYETLDAEDVKHIIEGGELKKPTVQELLNKEQKKEPESSEEIKESLKAKEKDKSESSDESEGPEETTDVSDQTSDKKSD